jgi:phosphoglycolate phosphatase
VAGDWHGEHHRRRAPDAIVKLVLFDIDGTLLWSDGAGRRAFTSALADVLGATCPPDFRFDGKTDRQIARELMRLAGHADDYIDARMTRLMDAYLAGLSDELVRSARQMHVFPGVRELLDTLEARDDIVLGLLTGNLHSGAIAKLSAAGLDPGRFRVGAFGSDHEHRPELPAVAQRRARETLAVDVPGSALVVIGDTPADLECGRAIGARAIGVATGRYSVEELRRYRPAAVFADLSDTAAVTDAIVRV